MSDDASQIKKFIQALEEFTKTKELMPDDLMSKLKTMEELERDYIEYARNMRTSSFDLGRWLPSFRRSVRNMVPGELVMILADTGVGKTACLQNIAMACAPLPTLMFEIELPGTLTFERFISLANGVHSTEVERSFCAGEAGRWKSMKGFENLLIVSESKLTVGVMEKLIHASAKKLKSAPVVVLVDYIGLIGAPGISRYERMSFVAEQLKVLAKATNTIIVCASQIHRKKDDEGSEVGLHDGKDSGSLENSAGLVLGVWKPTTGGKSDMKIKVLKNTKGRAGFIVDCHFHGESMQIVETSQKPFADL